MSEIQIENELHTEAESEIFTKKILQRGEALNNVPVLETLKALIHSEIDFLLWCAHHEEFFYLFKDNSRFIPKESPIKKLTSVEIKALYKVIYEKDMDDSPVLKFFNKTSEHFHK